MVWANSLYRNLIFQFIIASVVVGTVSVTALAYLDTTRRIDDKQDQIDDLNIKIEQLVDTVKEFSSTVEEVASKIDGIEVKMWLIFVSLIWENWGIRVLRKP